MITPRFELSQDENFVLLTVHCPHVKAQNTEFYIEGNEFKLFVKPYFLRLNLPGSVVENGLEKAEYDISSGIIKVQLPKEVPGQFFEDLDMLTKLLAKKNDPSKATQPLIQVIDQSSNPLGTLKDMVDQDEDFNWEIDQELPTEPILSTARYGFNFQYSGVFTNLQEEILTIIDIPNPENSTPQSRRELRIQSENDKFDEDYYIADYLEKEKLEEILSFQTVWYQAFRKAKKEQYEKKKGKEDGQKQEKQTEEPNQTLNIQNNSESSKAVSLLDNTFSASSSLHQKLLIDPPIESSSDVMINSNSKRKIIEALDTDSNNSDLQNSNTSILEDLRFEVSSLASKMKIVPVERMSSQSSTFKIEMDPNQNDSLDIEVKFIEEENEMLRNLPKKEYLIDQENKKAIYLSLVDIIFGYCYDHRTTLNDSTVESPWTIAKLSPTLSALEGFSTLRETLVACLRRSVCYPLYRNWELSMKVLKDVYVLFKVGRRAILKCLLQIKKMFEHDDLRYYLCKIYLDDYCIWIQTRAKDHTIQNLAHELNKIKIGKDELNFQLIELENYAEQNKDNFDEDNFEENPKPINNQDDMNYMDHDIEEEEQEKEENHQYQHGNEDDNGHDLMEEDPKSENN